MFSGLRELVNQTRCVATTAAAEPDDIVYQNIVCTISLARPGYSLPLERIMATNLGGFVKCTPTQFPGLVLRIKDSLGGTTHLLFRSGKMNIVGAKTIEHARCNAQFIRLYLESVEAPYLVDNNRIVLSNACGRLQFERFCVHLFVVSANLPVRPNLQVLQAHAPEISSWDPENFPGLKLRVWLRPRDKCACVRKKGRQGCACTATVILFDTGKFNVTGTKSVADINQTVQLIRDLFSDTRLCAVGAQLPAKMRYDQRLASILSSIDFCGQTRRPAPAAAKIPTAAASTGIFQYITTTIESQQRQQHGPAPSMLANFLSSLCS